MTIDRPHTTLITGGCRSGKSGAALELARRHNGSRRLFLATCVPADAEMKARVERHQAERGPQWRTLEEPLRLSEAIRDQGTSVDLILVDCLTLWISNLMAEGLTDEAILQSVAGLTEVIQTPPCALIFVTNEVGSGIVPENALARRFRDLCGWTNQRVAQVCRIVILTVAGIPVAIKPAPSPAAME
jgi:adenosylcobinamide kinase/adenosylcobinamide-phosphate guanylyltransferase